MTRRKEPMSVVAVGLLALVGGASLILYVLVAQHLAPPATLDRPIIISRNTDRKLVAPSAGLVAGGHANNNHQALWNAPGFVEPPAHDLIAAVLFTPSPGPTGAAPAPATSGSPPGDPTSTTPSPPPGSPNPTPSSPPPPTPTPSITPPGAPPIAAPIAWKGCGRSRGHRLHLPQSTHASTISAQAKGHELHPCKSQGRGGPPEPRDEPGSSTEYGSGHDPHGVAAGDHRHGSRGAGDGGDASDHQTHKRARRPVTHDHEKQVAHHSPSHPKGHDRHGSVKVHGSGQAHDGHGKAQGYDSHGQGKDHERHAHGDQAAKAHRKNK